VVVRLLLHLFPVGLAEIFNQSDTIVHRNVIRLLSFPFAENPAVRKSFALMSSAMY
jgi:hypothetical protein